MNMSRRITRYFSAAIIMLLLCGLLAGCGGGGGGSTSTPSPSSGGGASSSGGSTPAPAASAAPDVYYLNSKPEQDAQWQALAKAYGEANSKDVKVVSPAAGQYLSTLEAELAKAEAPSVYDVNGYLGLRQYGANAYDLSSSKVKGELTYDHFTLKDGSAIKGIAAYIDTFGLIYNKDLLAKAGYQQDDVMNFFRLREAVNDITARKADLGFVAFASTGLDASSSFRISKYMANIPIFMEYEFDNKTDSFELKGTFVNEYRNILDMYTNNNATVPRGEVAPKTMADSIKEFAGGEAVFMLNNTAAYEGIKSLGDDKIGMLPLYSSAYGEDKYGYCTGSDKFWVVNSKASAASIEATLDFLYWCVTSDAGVAALCGDLGLTIPYKSNKASSNALIKLAEADLASGKIPMAWAFTTAPNQAFTDELAETVGNYFVGKQNATDLANVYKKSWIREYEKEYGLP